MQVSGLNEYGRLKKLALRHPRDAFISADKVAGEWQALNYHAEPDYALALAQYETFIEILEQTGCEIEFLPASSELSLDALYVRDATLLAPQGIVACAMGKAERTPEPQVAASNLSDQGFAQAGAITGGGQVEGGDFVWLDEKTCAVGWGYRTNKAGIEQLAAIFGPQVSMEVVPLPHYKGPSDVFHLMSMLSPLDRDLALVYSPLMPVPFRNWLLERGLDFVEVPNEEFESMACNVLALAPRHCLMVEGNPETRRRLEAAGCQVEVYNGSEISAKGEGGPTCLTRPLVREG